MLNIILFILARIEFSSHGIFRCMSPKKHFEFDFAPENQSLVRSPDYYFIARIDFRSRRHLCNVL